MYGHGDGWGGGEWVAMVLMMLVFWAVIVAVILAFVRRSPSGSDTGGRPPHHEAERILSERFARGEIDEDEFRRRRDALRSGSTS